MVEIQALFSGVLDYFFSTVLPGVLSGDPASIVIIGIIVIVLLAVVFKISQILYSLIKRFFLFIVIAFSLYFFAVNFQDRIFSDSPDLIIVGIGVLGLLVGLVAFAISLFSVHLSFSKFRKSASIIVEDLPLPSKEQKQSGPTAPIVRPSQLQQPDYLSQQFLTQASFSESVRNDRSLLAVLSYAIIAQFGVFSGVTISAPSLEVGIAFFAAFFVGAFIFIKTSYHSYVRGVTHLVLAAIFGFGLSIILGHFWGTIPFEELLSLNYFTSNALVAFVTGIAISLLMGSKN